MLEFHAETGGRYMYADDMENLQDIALLLEKVFYGCDDCVIQGCEISQNEGIYQVSAGLVYLDGRIRQAAANPNIANNRYLIILDDTTSDNVKVAYADNTSKVGRHSYGTQWVNSTTATHKLEFTSDDTVKRLDRGLFGKYALLLNTDAQSVNGFVSFLNGLLAASVQIGDANHTITKNNNGVIEIANTVSGGTSSKLSIKNDAIEAAIGGTAKLTVGASNITAAVPVILNGGAKSGENVLDSNGLYAGGSNDTGTLWLNQKGKDGGVTQYRNMAIGDGRGNKLAELVSGSVPTLSLFIPGSTSSFFTVTGGATPEIQSGAILKCDDLRIKVGNSYEAATSYFAPLTTLTSNYVLRSYLEANYSTTTDTNTAIDTKINTFRNGVTTTNISVSDGTVGIIGNCYAWGKLRWLQVVITRNANPGSFTIPSIGSPINGSFNCDFVKVYRHSSVSTDTAVREMIINFAGGGSNGLTISWDTLTPTPVNNLSIHCNIAYFVN